MRKLSRRAFLGSAAVTLAGCSQVIDDVTQPDLPKTLDPPATTERHPTAHLLNRATYGIQPGQIRVVGRMGHGAWLDQQFNYPDIDDSAVDWRLRRYDTLSLSATDLRSFTGIQNRRYVANELATATLVRAVYSKRQLFEVMVGFWSDHFSIYHFKGDVYMLKTIDDRDVVRPHALGNFGDLLRESAHSPAMLIYLDNILNEKSHPNENYAREIMELHTLGVDGGYTEADIKEVARCFTGWSVDENGEFVFIPEWHDEGEKTVLGHTIRFDDRKSDGDQVLDILLAHPSTSRYVCQKLVRRFVADDPPQPIVDACVQTWTSTNGDIAQVMRTLFTHPDFVKAPYKLKRPFELLTSFLRITNAQYSGHRQAINYLDALGHRPFGWPTPDGYPDTADAWDNNLLRRWNLSFDLVANRIEGIEIDWQALRAAGQVNDRSDILRFFGRLFLNRALTDQEFELLASHQETPNQVLGVLAASPAFQWR